VVFMDLCWLFLSCTRWQTLLTWPLWMHVFHLGLIIFTHLSGSESNP